MNIPFLGQAMDWLNSKPYTRPALMFLVSLGVFVESVAPDHTLIDKMAVLLLKIVSPLVAASAGMSADRAKSADAEVAARGGPVAVLKGSKE